MTLNDLSYLRVAAAVPAVSVADVRGNKRNIIDMVNKANDLAAAIVVLPEMCLTGYTCADLFHNDLLLDEVEQALGELRDELPPSGIMVVIGAPVRHQGRLFNCAVVFNQGHMWVVPKTYIPNYKEFYEKRWFASALAATDVQHVTIAGREVPFSRNMIFQCRNARVAVELCEDLWSPLPPSTLAALNGANVLLNLSASNEVVGKHHRLRSLVSHQSDRCIAAYVYASAGYGESTTDLVFAGNGIIAENGQVLDETARFERQPRLALADVDLQLLENERMINNTFADTGAAHRDAYEFVPVSLRQPEVLASDLRRPVRPLPFVPDDPAARDSRCREVVEIQSQGLIRRLEAIGIKRLVVGISGGLDSTLALLVAVNAFDELGLDCKGIIGITMPGFGTTGRTHANALKMMEALGVTSLEISIAAAVTQHFADIGQDADVHDVTYENSQARERTQILMDYANKVGAIVLGTGDLSELALGWATYNGDHMSMYNVNGSIPKTLVRHLVGWFADHADSPTMAATLRDVVHTPVSPELTPADEHGNILQVTEDIVGPYELHDFYLYNMLRNGFAPAKLLFLAGKAFGGTYDDAMIKHWLTTFLRRFFTQQFKRSCMPDGPKVGNISLSPRGDWRMPSDVTARLWLAQLASLNP